jgi:hypothetical protein
MSKRLVAVLMLVLCGTAIADDADLDRVLRLGDSHWELYRPQACEEEISDFGFLNKGLRAPKPGFGLRFHSSQELTIDLRIDPITNHRDFVGPVYDMHIGATLLSFAVNF